MAITSEDSAIIVNILKKIDLMKDLNEEDHNAIIQRITLEYYPKDHVIFNEGDVGDAFYLIKKGMVRIYHPISEGRDTEEQIQTLGDNDFFGEMALISEDLRNASCQTLDDSEIFKMNKQDFIDLVSSDPNMAGRISDTFLERMKINVRREKEGE